MKNQKGIGLLTLIIIIAVIIIGIIFIVAMSQPQDGIGSFEEESEKWEKAKDNLNKANQNLQKAEDNYYNSLLNLKELEEKNR